MKNKKTRLTAAELAVIGKKTAHSVRRQMRRWGVSRGPDGRYDREMALDAMRAGAISDKRTYAMDGPLPPHGTIVDCGEAGSFVWEDQKPYRPYSATAEEP